MFTNYFIKALAATTALASLAAAAPVAQNPAIHRRQSSLKFPFPTEKVRGVNLGGWFVLEPWITPSIFEPWATSQTVVDEYTLCATLGEEAALSTLQAHWNSWITQDDFTQIAALGLNFVRIPIGYWAISPIEGDPYVQGAYEVLAQALDWASAAGLSVMVDIHGAPGSQNGFDNSGRRGGIGWGQGATVDQTLTAVNKLKADHGSHPALASIQLVNEPMVPSVGRGVVEAFYTTGYNDIVDDSLVVSLHDGFVTAGSWNEFLPGSHNILMDTHHYEVFDAGVLGMSPDAHVGSACAFGAGMATNTKSTIAGEWTSSITDCAKWLNGLGVGARYDGTFNYNGVGSSYIGSCAGKDVGTVDALPEDYKTTLTRFTEAQLDAYEKAQGWIFWCWKTETAPEWHFQNLTAAGIIPQPLTARKFPGQCN